MLYWHFIRNGRLRNGDRPALPPDGVEVYGGEPIPCVCGLHASIHPLHALCLAPLGPTPLDNGQERDEPQFTVRVVELRGLVLHSRDKSVGTERRILMAAPANEAIRGLAGWLLDAMRPKLQQLLRHPVHQNLLSALEAWSLGLLTAEELHAAQCAAHKVEFSTTGEDRRWFDSLSDDEFYACKVLRRMAAEYKFWTLLSESIRDIVAAELTEYRSEQDLWWALNDHLRDLLLEALQISWHDLLLQDEVIRASCVCSDCRGYGWSPFEEGERVPCARCAGTGLLADPLEIHDLLAERIVEGQL